MKISTIICGTMTVLCLLLFFCYVLAYEWAELRVTPAKKLVGSYGHGQYYRKRSNLLLNGTLEEWNDKDFHFLGSSLQGLSLHFHEEGRFAPYTGKSCRLPIIARLFTKK